MNKIGFFVARNWFLEDKIFTFTIFIVYNSSMRKILLSLFLAASLCCSVPASAFISPPIQYSPVDNSVCNALSTFFSVGYVSGATGYYFELDTSSNFNSPHLRWDTSRNSYVYTPHLLMGKKYYWRAKAYKSGDTSAWSYVRSFTVGTKMENNQPVNGDMGPLRALLVKGFSLTPVTYIWEVDTVNTFNSPFHIYKETYTEDNSFIDSSFRFGMTIYWRVKSANSFGDTMDWSDTWQYTIRRRPRLINPMAPSSYPQALIQWDGSFSAKVLVQHDTTNTFNSPALTEFIAAANNKDELKDLYFGKNAYWRVRDVFGTDSSEWSDTGIYAVKAGVGLNEPYYNETSVELIPSFRWQYMLGVSFRLQVSEDSLFNSILKDTVTTQYSYYGGLKLRMNRVYYWRIKIMHARDTTPWSMRYPFTTTDGRIYVSNPYNNTTNTGVVIPVQWTRLDGATDYLLMVDTTADFNSPLLISRPSFFFQFGYPIDTLRNLHYGTKYYIKVKAISDGDTSEDISFVSSFTTAFRPVNNFPGNGALEWGTSTNLLIDGINGSDSVIWEADTSLTFTSPELHTGNVLHEIDWFSRKIELPLGDSLLYSSKYYWRARCFNAVDTSDWSDIWWFGTTDNIYLKSPVNNAINQPVQVALKWSLAGSYDEHIYQYQLATDTAFTAAPITLTKGTPLEHTVNVGYGKKYYWRFRAMHSRDTSKWSPIWAFTTVNPPTLGKPFLASPLNMTTGLEYSIPVSLIWYSVLNAEEYTAEMSRDINFASGVVRGTTTGTAVNASSLSPNTRYYWRVKAMKDTFSSPWSDVWWFETKNNNVGIASVSAEGILVYPNPATSVITVEAPGKNISSLKVFSLQGKMLMEKENTTSLDIATLPPGLYILEIYSEEGMQQVKFVKK